MKSSYTKNSQLSVSQSSVIASQEVIVDTDLTKERVSKIVNDAENMLRSSTRQPRPQPHAVHTKARSTVDMKYRTQEILEVLEVVRVFL